jgi:hypothetical protein
MSSTSNVQNLLTNVFRPTFVFDNGVYQTKLELTNVDSVSANTVYGFTAAFGDASGNVYVGIGSGNPYSSLAASSNSSNTFVGTNAGASTSNVKNGVFLGYRAGFGTSNSSNSISIGANSINGGNSNIYIGYATGIASGSNNIFIGPSMSNGGTAVSNRLMIGSGSNTAIVGDLSSNRVGINLSNLPATTPNVTLDVNGFTRIGTNANGGLGINMLPGNYALDVTGAQRTQDGVGTLIFSNARLGVNKVGAAAHSLDVTGTQRIEDGVGTLTFSNGTQTSTGGFRSVSGTTGSIASGATSNIGTTKRGVIIVSGYSTTDPPGNTSSRIIFCTESTGSNGSVSIYTNQMAIAVNSSNISFSNEGFGAHIYNYSITYFPTP